MPRNVKTSSSAFGLIKPITPLLRNPLMTYVTSPDWYRTKPAAVAVCSSKSSSIVCIEFLHHGFLPKANQKRSRLSRQIVGGVLNICLTNRLAINVNLRQQLQKWVFEVNGCGL